MKLEKNVNLGLTKTMYEMVEREAELMSVTKPEFIRYCIKVVVTARDHQRKKNGNKI